MSPFAGLPMERQVPTLDATYISTGTDGGQRTCRVVKAESWQFLQLGARLVQWLRLSVRGSCQTLMR